MSLEMMSESQDELVQSPKRFKSEVCVHFGFRQTDGKIIEDGYPICRKCVKRVAAKKGNTSNLMSHLRDHHPPLAIECKVS